MAETKIECPHCGRVGSTTRAIHVGANVRCPGCRGSFRFAARDDGYALETPAGPLVFEPIPEPRHPEPQPIVTGGSAAPPPRRRTRLVLAVGIAGLLAFAAGAGWLASRGVATRSPTIVKEDLTTEQVAARSEASVGFIAGPTSSGTGFLVAPGLLATNAHVIDSTPPDQIRVTFPAAAEIDRGPVLGRVVHFDPARDLAILRVSTRLPPLKTAVDHAFRRGQDVVVIGNPGIGDGRALECVVSRGVLGSEVVEAGRTFYQLSGSVNPGNSGGPALDLAGRVVGVVTLKARQEGLAFCIPAGDLGRAIRQAATQPEVAARRAADGHIAVVAAAERGARLAAALDRTDPATWIAMVDLGRDLEDDAPEAVATRADLNRADALYAEVPAEIATVVFKVVELARDAGDTISAREVLAGSLDWASPSYFNRGKAVEFGEYARLYLMFLRQRKTHPATMASVRAFYRATVGPLEPRPAPTRPPATEARRVARAPQPPPEPERSPSLPSGSTPPTVAADPALSEALELARSLERQRKTRAALRHYRDLVDDHPGSFEADQAAERIAALTRPPSFGNRRPARVLEVPDGRTVVVDLGGSRTAVRLIGLEALPTNSTSRGPGRPGDAAATAFLRDLVAGRAVHLDYERGAGQSDGEGHTLAYLYRADDLLAVNREVIARGFGVASRYGAFSQADDFRDADARARSRKVGLWRP